MTEVVLIVVDGNPTVLEKAEQGPPGAGADGLSAYELAVQEGFSGSLDDWLASLVGPAGEPGEVTEPLRFFDANNDMTLTKLLLQMIANAGGGMELGLDGLVFSLVGGVGSAFTGQALDISFGSGNNLRASADGFEFALDNNNKLALTPAGLTFIKDGVNFLYPASGLFAPLLNVSLPINADPAAAGYYARFTGSAPKTYTFRDTDAFVVPQEFHGRNVSAGDLTLMTEGIFVINPPYGGTLVIPQGGTFTIKIVSATEADLFGVTVPV